MKDKIPSKFTGFFITVLGTGILLRFFASILDRIFFVNIDFKITEYRNFVLIIFILSIFMGIAWMYRTREIRD